MFCRKDERSEVRGQRQGRRMRQTRLGEAADHPARWNRGKTAADEAFLSALSGF